MVELVDGHVDNTPTNGGAPHASSSSAARQAQLAQLKELEAKLDEDRQQACKLRTALEQERTARGAQAQAAGVSPRNGSWPTTTSTTPAAAAARVAP